MYFRHEQYPASLVANSLRLELKPLIDVIIENKIEFKNNQFKSDYLSFKESYAKENEKKDWLLNSLAKEWYDPESYEQGGHIIANFMFAYLGLIETVGRCLVDIVVLILVANGEIFEYKSHGKDKIVTCWKDIQKNKISLYEELRFLDEHDIIAFRYLLDNHLRNDIAHINFRVDPDNGLDEWIYLPLRDENGHKIDEVFPSAIIPSSITGLLDCIEITENLIFKLDCLIEAT